MIVLVLIGIGACLLVLMQGKGDQRPTTKETPMTPARLAQMLADDKLVQRPRRAHTRRPSTLKGNRGNQRAMFAKEI